ncbi:MAG: UDP-N-acetylmuramoyl-L-alanine--D-glutamate ligase [Chitinispirillaceae bacterium]|nr:UDP-N-acetylmuramoyl-L-alanine--D-glutamate ligase [Chitinispirillaceae bacterium]
MPLEFDFKEKYPGRVSIIGAARSGLAVAKFLRKLKISVFISDTCSTELLVKRLSEYGLDDVEYESGRHSEAILKSDLIIISPGVPSDLPIIIKAETNNIPVWSEVELAFRISKAPFLAVTGSSGKSTTVSLLDSILTEAKVEHILAGNIGIPLISMVNTVSESGFVVAEVSSFQLEKIVKFTPKVAAITNLLKNHLDRYPSEEAYYNAKKNIAKNFTKDNYLVVNGNDKKLTEWVESIKNTTNIIYVGVNLKNRNAIWLNKNELVYRINNREEKIGNIEKIKIPGQHNLENAAIAAIMAKIIGTSNEDIVEGICKFNGLPHRLEFVGKIGGVYYYNDSKSTTAESIEYAVKAFPPLKIHLIAGGKDKGCDFSAIRDTIKANVKDIVLIGEAAERMEKEWKDIVTIYRADTLQKAIEIATQNSIVGDYIIFSPGCSSFDMFRDFEERGDKFKEIVSEMNLLKRKYEQK